MSSTPLPSFKTLQEQHAQLLKDQQAGQDVTQPAKQYLTKVQFAGARIGNPRQREQLRANLRYWASYVYEKTNAYPQVELAPYNGPTFSPGLLFSLIVILLLIILAILAFPTAIFPLNTPEATTQSSPTPTESQTSAPSAPTVTVTLTQTPTPEPDLVQTVIILNRTLQPIIVTPAPAPLEILALDEPSNGAQLWVDDKVVTLRGRYSNLQPGWTIYLVVQPLSTAGRYFGLPLYTLPANAPPDGTWQAELEIQALLPIRTKSDTLVLTLALSNQTDVSTSLLESNKQGGAQSLPSEMLVLRSAPVVWYVSRR